MSTIQEIETAIAKLAPQDYSQVRNWFLDFDNQRWDQQITDDSAAGRLDYLVREVEADIAQGRVKPLDEIGNDS